jgi:hypothetical protein
MDGKPTNSPIGFARLVGHPGATDLVVPKASAATLRSFSRKCLKFSPSGTSGSF